MTRAVAISLKIPDNEAYTALVALKRLGVAVERVERAEIYFFRDCGDVDALKRRIVSDETIFNPNKHRLSILEETAPRGGEVWIEPLGNPEERALARGPKDAVAAAISWRLFDAGGAPVALPVLDMATERLLCNPAIDRVVARD